MKTRLIEDKSELEGTCYFEFVLGTYKGACWQDSSVFLDDETFELIEPIFQQHLPHFDHYAFTEVSRSDWTNILKDLQLLRQKLSSAQSIADIKSCLRFPSTAAEETFNVDYHKNVADLGKLIDELTAWIERNLAHFDTISILGL